MQSSNPLKKNKSKTTLMQKFVDKFKKKKRSKSSASAMPSKELSRERAIEHNVKEKRDSRSPSKNSGGGKPAKPVVDLTEVTAKAYRKEKEKKSSREKRSAKKRGRKEEESSANEAVKIAPSKTPSCNMIGPAPSQIDSTHNQKVEKGVQKWVEAFAKIDFKKVLDQDFKPIIAMDPDLAKCTVFDKNREWCQSDNLELLDANRVKLDDTDFFYHGSIVSAPNITPKIVMAQLPLRDEPQCLEAFWLMVAAQKMQRVFVLLGPDELDKKALNDYFPEDFVEHKTIRVNNRKTVPRSEEQTNDQLYYEVVPKDCAEAPFAMMEICDFWPDAKIPTVSGRPAITAASVFESDIDAEASIGVVSNFGAGRAGSFIVAALAIEKLRAAEIPNIRDLAVLVRNQRPGAIETFPQYVFSHIIPLTYSLKHVMSATLKAKVEKLISQLEQFAFEKMTEDDDDEEEDATD